VRRRAARFLSPGWAANPKLTILAASSVAESTGCLTRHPLTIEKLFNSEIWSNFTNHEARFTIGLVAAPHGTKSI
jgi:hypothetical protein